MNRRRWLIAIPVVVVLAVVVGPWVYINLIRDDPPERLSFDDVTTTTAEPDSDADSTTTTAGGDAPEPEGVEGTWTVTEGSQAGYRVKEILFGQDAEAVGRTTEVSGTMEISGTQVVSAEITVDMASVRSDESMRDGQFRGRIMDTSTHPTATFSLTSPISLDPVPADGEEVTYSVTGDLTLRGVTREVTFDLTARLNGGNVEATGSIEVSFDDFEIPDASGGPASVGRTGELELLLVFTR